MTEAQDKNFYVLTKGILPALSQQKGRQRIPGDPLHIMSVFMETLQYHPCSKTPRTRHPEHQTTNRVMNDNRMIMHVMGDKEFPMVWFGPGSTTKNTMKSSNTPFPASHTMELLSMDPDTRNRPSGDHAKS